MSRQHLERYQQEFIWWQLSDQRTVTNITFLAQSALLAGRVALMLCEHDVCLSVCHVDAANSGNGSDRSVSWIPARQSRPGP